MKASFDGARIRLAESFNRLTKTELSPEQLPEMRELRECVGGLLCMYDPDASEETNGDCNDLSGTVKLEELPEETKR